MGAIVPAEVPDFWLLCAKELRHHTAELYSQMTHEGVNSRQHVRWKRICASSHKKCYLEKTHLNVIDISLFTP